MEVVYYMDLAFLDIDGTLSVPRYLCPDGKYRAGMPQEAWEKYCERNYNAYVDCGTPAPMYELLSDLKGAGAKLRVLSTESMEAAKISKSRFIEDNYKEFFTTEDIIFVESSDKKVPVILEMCQEEGIPADRAYYMDDDFGLVLEALDYNIAAHHISELFLYKRGELW